MVPPGAIVSQSSWLGLVYHMADRIVWNGDGANEYVKGRALTAVRLICAAILARARLLLSIPGSGRVRGRKAGPVVRSQPGQPPFKQTGTLRASVQQEIDASTQSGRVGTNLRYGLFLETGTRRGLAPRPWLRPAFEYVKTQIDAILAPLNRTP